jgi:hypothetical protein
MLMIAFYRELVKPELDDCSIEDRYILAADNLETKLRDELCAGTLIGNR